MGVNGVTTYVNNVIRNWDGDTRCYCGLLARVETKERGGHCIYRCPKGICDPDSCGFILRLPSDKSNAISRQHQPVVKGCEAATNPGTERTVFNTNRALDEGRSIVDNSSGSLREEVNLAAEHSTKNQRPDKNSVDSCTIQESLAEERDAVLQDGVSKQTSNLNAPSKRSREPIDGASDLSERANSTISMKFCLRCDGKGHWGKECQVAAEPVTILQPAAEKQKEAGPFEDKSTEGKCFHCQGEGHWAKHCPAKRRKQDDCPVGLSFPGVCHNCSQPGHWARDCKMKQFQKQAGLLTRPQGLCYKCKKPGHWSKECPMSNKYGVVSPSSSSVIEHQSHKSLSQRGGGGFGEPIW